MSRLNLRMMAVLALIGAAMAHPAPAATIKVCDDASEWPPYTFVDRTDKTTVVGAATDIIRTILTNAGDTVEVSLLPWKRCLLSVENGEIDMLMNGSYSEERAKTFYLSKPYYEITSGLFYNTKKFPQKPTITAIDQLKDYKYCGIFGYNYGMYPIPESQIDFGGKNEAQRFGKLRLERCDFAIGDVESVKGFEALGDLDLSGIDWIPIPGAEKKKFYMLISRKSANGEALLKTLNDGLDQIKADGSYAAILKKYGI